MKTVLRIVDTGLKPPRWNVAATGALLELHRACAIPDTVRFHRYPRSILLGQHQDPLAVVDVEACRRLGVEIARRVTGGGAVYMSPTILAFDLVAARSRFGQSLDEISVCVGMALAGGLRRLGIPGAVPAAGGVEIDGYKVSGASGSFDGPTLLMQGTMLIDFDRTEMAQLLTAHSRVGGRAPGVASLADFLGRVPGVEEVQSALLAEMCQAWLVPLTMEDLATEEQALAEALLTSEIGTEAFVMGELADAVPMPAATRFRKAASA
jgi:lipoate---protein ligase